MESNALVLVADDDAVVRALHRYLLEELGFRVIEAEDGQRAVELTKKYCFYAICVDVDMPKLSGIEVTRIIRQLEAATRHTLIIGITSLKDQEYNTCLSAGMDAVLNKPVLIDGLSETLCSNLVTADRP